MTTTNLDLEKQPVYWGDKRTHLTPMIILPFSDAEDEINNLKHELSHRLKKFIAIDVVRWMSVKRPSDKIIGDQIRELISPFQSLKLWQRLVDEELVDDLPDENNPIEIHFVILYDGINSADSSGAETCLNQILETIDNALAGKVKYFITLILFGDLKIQSVRMRASWTCLRIGVTGLGGMEVSYEQIYQVCQTILVALLTSNLYQLIKYKGDLDPDHLNWITIGSSLLFVDIDSMKSYFEYRLLLEFLNDNQQSQPDEKQIHILANAMAIKAEQFQSDLAKEAAKLAEGCQWNVELTDRCVLGVRMASGSSLAQLILGADWWQDPLWVKSGYSKSRIKRFMSSFMETLKRFIYIMRPIQLPNTQNLVETLAENYFNLDQVLIKNLSLPASTGYQHLLTTLRFLLERKMNSANENPPLSLNTSWPTGIQVIAPAAQTVIDKLSNYPKLIDPKTGRGIPPASLSSREFWLAAAEQDTMVIEGAMRRYRRFSLSVLSPLGILLMLIPAWPLSFGLFDIFTSWSINKTAVFSALPLIVLGLLEMFYWRFIRANRLIMQIQREVLKCLTKRVSMIMAKSITDYSCLVVQRLESTERVFSNLSEALLLKLRGIESWLANQSPNTSNQEIGTYYRLVDFQEIETWISGAYDEANANLEEFFDQQLELGEYSQLSNAIIGLKAMPLLHTPASVDSILQVFDRASKYWTDKAFNKNMLETYVLAEKIEPLTGGKKWRWLQNRAHPLGTNAGAMGQKQFTAILCPTLTSIKGASGTSSNYWQNDWTVLRSLQTNELACIRGVVELQEGE